MYLKASILFILLLSSIASLGQGLEKTIEMAEAKLAEGAVSDAVSLYRRAVFFDKEGAYLKASYQKLSYCYEILEDWNNAAEFCDLAYFLETEREAKNQLLLRKCHALIRANLAAEARYELLNLSQPTGLQDSLAQFLKSWSLLLDQDTSAYAGLRFLLSTKEQEDLKPFQRKWERSLRKKPNLAFGLSVLIPGAGQVYAGNGKEALNSILLLTSLTTAFYLVQIKLGLFNASIALYPWIQRYYFGGAVRARMKVLELREFRRNQLLLYSLESLSNRHPEWFAGRL